MSRVYSLHGSTRLTMFCVFVNTFFIETEIAYDGSQLQSHWILKNTGQKGDTIVGFIGPCNVKLDSMVDLEDVLAQKSIYSESMLHFIVEHFDHDLEKAICRQRLLITLLQEELHLDLPAGKVVRRGDDLFIDENKLSVSIATISPVSTLIHVGINILSRNTPVPTLGLEDLQLNPHAFARSVLNRYRDEIKGMAWARAKVRSVL